MISDAHEGLRRAISEILAGASWQRSRVHFMRNVLQKLPRHAQGPIAALVRTIFAQPDRAAAGRQLGIFPNPQAVLRLLGAVLEELHEDWMVSRRYFSCGSCKARPNLPRSPPGQRSSERGTL